MRTLKATLSRLLIVGLTVSLLTACKKYDEGPGISFRSKKARIENTWVIEQALLGGVDSTQYYAVEGTEFSFNKGGDATGIQIRTNGIYFDTTNYTGNWELHEKNEAFALILTDAITQEIDTNWWWIRRLKNQEFWLEEEGSSNSQSEYIKLKQKGD